MKKIILVLVLVASFGISKATLSVSPTSASLKSAGSQDTLVITSNVAWTAVVDSSWVTIISGSSGTGNSIVVYTIQPNNRIALMQRVAHITITPASGTAQIINISQYTSYVAKGLHGTYIKINSYVGISIPVKEGDLGAKTSPTVFYWMEADTSVIINTRQLSSQGLATLRTTFRLYYDYQSYWQWKPPFDCNFSTVFTTPWEDFSDGGWSMVDNYDALLNAYISQTLNIPLVDLFDYDY